MLGAPQLRTLQVRAISYIAILVSMAGCASKDPGALSGAQDPAYPEGAVSCRGRTGVERTSPVAAPTQTSTGLCNVHGGMTLCRPSTAIGDDRMEPLSAWTPQEKRVLEPCDPKEKLRETNRDGDA